MTFKREHIELSAYWTSIKRRGAVAAWPQLDPYYRFGFVIRLLWLGLVFRLGARPAAVAQRLIAEQNERRQRAWAREANRLAFLDEEEGYQPTLEDMETW